MAVLQSTFGETYDKGYAGMDASGELSNIITRTLESASVAFGKALYAGTADNQAVTTPSARLLGFALADKSLPVTSTRAADTFITGDNVAIKNRGSIWVSVSVAVADGDLVYVTNAGVITNVSTSNTLATGWEFQDTLAAAGIGRIVRR
ncbi:hypothetical protein [Novosphingobium sp.]|uniref:structural cement protein Gp24 n=1 Tax=Novosphingobium sp. TaxID=1874826 RepID=UPI00286E4BC3|nr:hypothetical protein [Novosphingobium sp.]